MEGGGGLLGTAKVLAIQLFFGTTFLLAAWLKCSAGIPDWFLQQFGATWLAALPGGLPAVYYFLALLESIALLGFVVSLLRGEFLPGRFKQILKTSLTFSLFIFTVFAFGSRLTGKFDVASINLLYFLGALISCREVGREEP